MSSKKRFPNSLRRYRRIMGYSQVEVARILGLKSKGRLSEWERGQYLPSARNLIRLSILYHTLIEQLYCDLRKEILKDLESRDAGSIESESIKK